MSALKPVLLTKVLHGFSHSVQQACSAFYVAWAASAKFCLNMGYLKLDTQNEEEMSIQYTFYVCFLYFMYN
jgi:hypothetical protein